MPTRRVEVPAKRKTIWANSRISGVVSIPQTNAIVLLDLLAETEAQIGVNNIPGATVGTIIGKIGLSAAAETTAIHSEGQVNLGICLVDLDQSNIPDPGTDDYDWLWLSRGIQMFTRPDQRDAASAPYLPEIETTQVVHNRSKRVLRQNHTKLVLVGEFLTGTFNSGADHAPQASAAFRTIVYLP